MHRFEGTAPLTTKHGLTHALRKHPNLSANIYPACFDLCVAADRLEFQLYFLRLTACSVLRMRGGWETPAALVRVAADVLRGGTRGGGCAVVPPALCHALLEYAADRLGSSYGSHPLAVAAPKPTCGRRSSAPDTAAARVRRPRAADRQHHACGPLKFREASVGLDSRHLYDANWVRASKAGSTQLARIRARDRRIRSRSHSHAPPPAESEHGAKHTARRLAGRATPSAEEIEALLAGADAEPQAFISGSRCWWVVKPGARARGEGIRCEVMQSVTAQCTAW